MSTVDSVFLIITGSILSLFFLISCVAVIYLIKTIKIIRSAVRSAETLIDNVGSATETFKNIGRNAGGPLAFVRVIENIFKMVHHD